VPICRQNGRCRVGEGSLHTREVAGSNQPCPWIDARTQQDARSRQRACYRLHCGAASCTRDHARLRRSVLASGGNSGACCSQSGCDRSLYRMVGPPPPACVGTDPSVGARIAAPTGHSRPRYEPAEALTVALFAPFRYSCHLPVELRLRDSALVLLEELGGETVRVMRIDAADSAGG